MQVTLVEGGGMGLSRADGNRQSLQGTNEVMRVVVFVYTATGYGALTHTVKLASLLVSLHLGAEG